MFLLFFLTSQCSNIKSGISPDMCLIHDYVNFSCYAIYLLFVFREFLKTILPMHLSDIAFYGDLQIICGETILLAVFIFNEPNLHYSYLVSDMIFLFVFVFSLLHYVPFTDDKSLLLHFFFYLLLMSTSSIV